MSIHFHAYAGNGPCFVFIIFGFINDKHSQGIPFYSNIFYLAKIQECYYVLTTLQQAETNLVRKDIYDVCTTS